MDAFWQDIKYGLRRLKNGPRFTSIALVTLAIGIGANTIMFSIVDVLLFLRPRKVKAPEQLAYCAIQGVNQAAFRDTEYLTLRDSGLAFSGVMAETTFPYPETLARRGTAHHVLATYVSADYFSVLGVTPVMGRGFLPEEERPSSAPVAILSYRCWQRLGGDLELVGEFLSVNGIDCQVVGVASEGFTGVTLMGPDLWVPFGSFQSVSKLAQPDRKPWFYVVGRLKPGLTMSVAQAQLQALFPQFGPECIDGKSLSNPAINLRPPGRGHIPGDYDANRRLLAVISVVLMGASAIILVIACMNLANMLIVQGAARHREIAVRMAIGGGRWRIIRQLLVEALLLAILGGSLGILVAFCGTRILHVWIAAAQNGAQDLQPHLNVRILAATLGFCLMATLLFGLRPALWLSKRDIANETKGCAGRVLGSFRRRRGRFLAAGQVALAVTLVLGAALLTRSALQMTRPDRQFSLTDKLIVQVDPLAAGYDQARSIQACEALADHLASLSEVQAVGTSPRVFFGGGGQMLMGEYSPPGGERRAGRPLAREAALVGAGKDYFTAMEIALLQGRLFDQRDTVPSAEKVAIVDESLARKLRPDGNALGCLIQWGTLTKLVSDPYRVVGIVAHMPGVENRNMRAQMYTPPGPNDLSPCFYLHVTNKHSMEALRQRIGEEIRRVDPRIPVLSVATLAEKRRADDSVWRARFGARLGLAAGLGALFLAALGIYATEGYIVASRASEIGIRIALGATRERILGMILREGLLSTMVGLVVGLGLGLAVAKVAARILYGISPIDPVSIAATVVLLGTTSLLAGYLPARRAAKVDPMETLRSE